METGVRAIKCAERLIYKIYKQLRETSFGVIKRQARPGEITFSGDLAAGNIPL